MIIINGIPYNDVKSVATMIEHMGMLRNAIDAFFVLYNYNRYTLLDVHVRLMQDTYLEPGYVYVIFTYTLTKDWENFLLNWGKKDG